MTPTQAHVTGVDISRNDQLKALGNGVVPQQAELALRWLLFGEWAGVDGDVVALPTPAVNDMGAGKTVEAWDEWTDRMKAEHGNGNGHGKSLAIEAQRLLPTPSVADAMGWHLTRSGDRFDELLLPGVAKMLGGAA